VNLSESYANLQDCGASRGIVKSSHLLLVVDIGTKQNLGDLQRPHVRATVVGDTVIKFPQSVGL